MENTTVPASSLGSQNEEELLRKQAEAAKREAKLERQRERKRANYALMKEAERERKRVQYARKKEEARQEDPSLLEALLERERERKRVEYHRKKAEAEAEGETARQEDPVQREARLQRDRERKRLQYARKKEAAEAEGLPVRQEDPEQREARLQRERERKRAEYHRKKEAAIQENPDLREALLQRELERKRRPPRKETPEQREARLHRDRERKRRRARSARKDEAAQAESDATTRQEDSDERYEPVRLEGRQACERESKRQCQTRMQAEAADEADCRKDEHLESSPTRTMATTNLSILSKEDFSELLYSFDTVLTDSDEPTKQSSGLGSCSVGTVSHAVRDKSTDDISMPDVPPDMVYVGNGAMVKKSDIAEVETTSWKFSHRVNMLCELFWPGNCHRYSLDPTEPNMIKITDSQVSAMKNVLDNMAWDSPGFIVMESALRGQIRRYTNVREKFNKKQNMTAEEKKKIKEEKKRKLKEEREQKKAEKQAEEKNIEMNKKNRKRRKEGMDSQATGELSDITGAAKSEEEEYEEILIEVNIAKDMFSEIDMDRDTEDEEETHFDE